MFTGEKLGQAIEIARLAKGISKVELATAFGVRPPSVQAWVKRGTIEKDKLPLLWAYFSDVVGPEHWGLEAWPYPQAPTAGVSVHPVAQSMSPLEETVAPTMSWEQLMTKPQELPPEFHVVLADDAMAPRAAAGVKVKFNTTRKPAPGDAVLVADGAGQLYFREYRVRLGGAWEAHATNPAYPSLQSDTHQLSVLAVFIGIDTSWAALAR